MVSISLFFFASLLVLFVILQSSSSNSSNLSQNNSITSNNPTNSPETPQDQPKLSNTSIPTLPYTSLVLFIEYLKSTIPRANSEAFSPPSEQEKLKFYSIIQQILLNQTSEVISEISSINYELYRLYDEHYEKEYFILLENQFLSSSGQGSYIISNNYTRNIILELPHPLFDLNTLEESTTIFQQTNGRAIFISGTHRCANSEYSPCSGSTSVCNNGQSLPFRISDVAHYTNNFFHEAHRAAYSLSSSSPINQIITISVHGNGDETIADVMLSDGTNHISDDYSLVNRLRSQLIDLGVSVASCNSIYDQNNVKLCGTTNVQARLSNGSEDPCLLDSNDDLISGLFIHLEQHLNIRNDPSSLIIALNDVIPSL